MSIAGPPLSGFREDIVSVLGPVLGTAKVNQFIAAIETHIREQARAGALEAIPEITRRVKEAARGATPDIVLEVEAAAKQAVKPLVVASIAASVLAIGIAGFVWLRR